MSEAAIEQTAAGTVPAADGWFILNVGELAWSTVPGNGTWCLFESPAARSPLLGIGIHVLLPGETPGYYHAENDQEGFLVLSGECIAVVEGEERRMGPLEYLHCPPGTPHITVGAGDGPCAILMVGTRTVGGIRYLVDAAAARHGASVAHETDDPEVAYAGRPPFRQVPAPPPFHRDRPDSTIDPRRPDPADA